MRAFLGLRPPAWTTLGVLLPAIAIYLFAACSLVALSWDGSGYLFNSLQSGAPVIPHQRYSNFLMLWTLVQARAVFDQPAQLGVGYGLLLSLTPLLSLIACLSLLRGPRLEPLRIWPVMGILLGVLPGEICLMSEASLAVQAFWPLVAFSLAGAPRRGIPWMILFSAYLFFLHPTTAVMFGIAAALCLMAAAFRAEGRRSALTWTGIFGILAASRLFASVLFASKYERGEFAWEPNRNAFIGAIQGWPMLMLAAIYLLALIFLVAGFGRIVPRLAWYGILATGAAFLGVGYWWAADATLWNGAISYRRFVLACALPLVALAAAHWWALFRSKAAPEASFFRRACVFATWMFVIVFGVQLLAWRSEVARFGRALETAPAPFVTTDDLPWMHGSPLHHWSGTMLSVLIQGRKPRTIFVEHRESVVDGNIVLFAGDGGLFSKRDGWFLVDPSHR